MGSGIRTIAADDPVAVAATAAVHSGDLAALRDLLTAHPWLATARIGDPATSRTLLHVATDWPGHFPSGAQAVRLLLAAGADVNARCVGPHRETALHWAASSDDVEVLDVLIAAGADLEAAGGVIAGGSPLWDATAFGQWRAARRLVEHGAHADLWPAAALGLQALVDGYLAADPAPAADQLTGVFWGACHGGQLATARRLLAAGADLNWVGWDDLTPLAAARRSGADAELEGWLIAEGAR